MTKINEVDAYKFTGATDTQSSKGVKGSQTSEAFMGLLLAQLKNQSPMDPMDDNQMISQMAQLNSLQELQTINTSLKELAKSNQFLSAAGLIGKAVKYSTDDIEAGAGIVSSISMDGDDILLSVGKDTIPLSALSEVSEA
jgi:flagellar basal-body rod modification protein FlgD